ncbi:MAG: peptidylprolyl isomerase [Bacteroidia bacterium]
MTKAILYTLLLSVAVVSQTPAQTKKASAPKAVSTPVKASKPVTPTLAITDPILMVVAGENVPKSEFDRVFRKNNKDSVFTEASVREYLDLYINYKLKVKEAESMKMDTSETFKNELSGYNKQLAQPYLTDKDVSENLIQEAYERLGKDVKASHVLLKVNPDALPKDTVLAYNRILKIRDMIMKGADFGKVARDSSEDPSAKENNGELGYFTGMQMVYPFETVAFNTKPGTVSMPVRTRFGYHIIKVLDIRPAQGEIQTAHIMIRIPKDANDSLVKASELRMNEVVEALKKGMPWDSAVTMYSEDKGSVKKGGELPWFGTGKMVPEFEKVAFALKNKGDRSGVIKTMYGFHIIQLLDKRGIPPFAEKKAELKQLIARDSRNEASRLSMVSKIKKAYKYKEIPKVKDEFIASLDSSVAEGDWDLSTADKFTKTIFVLTDSDGVVTNYSQQDFAKYVSTHQTKRTGNNPQAIGYSMYDQWVGDAVLSYLEERLEKIYPDFRNLMREYRDGILLFDLTDKMVWSKAVKDTAGLEVYHEANKNNYKWAERCDVTIYTCADAKVAADLRKGLTKKKKTAAEIVAELNKTNASAVTTRDGKFGHGENEIVEAAGWKTGLSADVAKNNMVHIVDVKSILPPTPKTLEEAKGVVTADYQTYLEKTWLQSLHDKYSVKVNNEVLESMWK